MELEIKLGDGQLFWFLPGGKCHLSSDNPGPIVIDFKSLSKDEQKQIILSGRAKVINLSIHDVTLVEEFNGVKTALPSIEEVISPTIVGDKLTKKLEALLRESNNTIKKEIGFITNNKELNILRDLEIADKNRNKILSLISDRIKFIEDTVIENIITEESDAEIKSEDPVADSIEVLDSETETREIPLDGDNN